MFFMMLLAAMSISASAQNKKAENKPVFTTVKEIPITSIKDQNRSGTCWDYSTLSYFEAEINGAMAAPIEWAPGLPLKGDGYVCSYYKKD